jgi:hypothetical protein
LFADPQIIITYLRHNVVWEEQNNIESIYILWPEAMQGQGPLSDSYMTWYGNTPIWMNEKSGMIEFSVQCFFNQRVTCLVDYDYKIVEFSDNMC